MTNLTDRLTDFADKVVELHDNAYTLFKDADDAEKFYISTVESAIEEIVDAVNAEMRKVLR